MGPTVIFIALIAGGIVGWYAYRIAFQVWVFGKFTAADKHPVGLAWVPGPPSPIAVAFQSFGFDLLGAVRAPSPGAPDTYTIIGYAPALGACCRVWVGDTGTTGPFSVKSRVAGGTLATMRTHTPMILEQSLEQCVRNGTPADLLHAHGRALAFLERHGVLPEPLYAAEWFDFFVSEWDAEAQRIRQLSFAEKLSLACRIAFGRVENRGLLEEQRGIANRLRRAPFG